jgi:hypothetical protein
LKEVQSGCRFLGGLSLFIGTLDRQKGTVDVGLEDTVRIISYFKVFILILRKEYLGSLFWVYGDGLRQEKRLLFHYFGIY